MSSAGLRSQNPRNSPAIPVVLFSQIGWIHEPFRPHLCEFIFVRALSGRSEKQHFSKIITDSRGFSSFPFQHSLAQTNHQSQSYLSTFINIRLRLRSAPANRTRAGQYSNTPTKAWSKISLSRGNPKPGFNLKRIYSNRPVCQEMIF